MGHRPGPAEGGQKTLWRATVPPSSVSPEPSSCLLFSVLTPQRGAALVPTAPGLGSTRLRRLWAGIGADPVPSDGLRQPSLLLTQTLSQPLSFSSSCSFLDRLQTVAGDDWCFCRKLWLCLSESAYLLVVWPGPLYSSTDSSVNSECTFWLPSLCRASSHNQENNKDAKGWGGLSRETRVPKQQEEINCKGQTFFSLLYTRLKELPFKSVLPWWHLVPPKLHLF